MCLCKNSSQARQKKHFDRGFAFRGPFFLEEENFC
nr:MAG TPA: catestatin choromogranin A [Caudoviricetes sp.]